MNPVRAAWRKLTSRRPANPGDGARRQRSRAVRDAIGKGNNARDNGDWAEAASHYAAALELDGGVAGIRVQLGHAHKELGQLADAETAYRQAVQTNPDDADARMQLGHVLKKQGRIDAAIEAYLLAYECAPDLTAARDAVIDAGGRDRLPGTTYGLSSMAASLSRLSASLDQTLAAIREGSVVSAHPVVAYDAFRRQYPVQPPPGPTPKGGVLVLIDVAGATPAALRVTLTHLMDQRMVDWTALVPAEAAMADHPVGSLALIDPRIRFVDADSIGLALAAHAERPVVTLSAGTLLDREALGWFRFALDRTCAGAVYADHDHYEIQWQVGPVWFQPVLQAMASMDDMAGSPHPPAAMIMSPALGQILVEVVTEGLSGGATRRRLWMEAVSSGPVAHLPRILASAPIALAEGLDPVAVPVAMGHSAVPDDARILVVIPTRDEPAILANCIQSLLDKAASPELLDLIVIDNRSVQTETTDLLIRLTAEGRIQSMAMDEPFNWARFNTLAVTGRTQEILVFSNNDVEMQTTGWDERLRAHLARQDIGVVGARLMYPDMTLQHGGILLGSWQGRPSHEGVGARAAEGGPTNRWRRSRAVAAVTGAFMACRREVFERVGGFDPLLAIAYNDVDFCLKVRAADMTVLYAADISLIHHESRTRGYNDVPEKVAWDDAELADMHRRWGPALLVDPGVNPQWVGSASSPFNGYKDLGLRRVLQHLDASAAPRPWTILPALRTDTGSV